MPTPSAPILSVPPGRPEFEGFADYYTSRIRPYLAERDGARRRAVQVFVAIIAGVGVLAGLFAALGPIPGANVQLAALGATAGFGAASWTLSRARADITHGLLARICEGLGLSYAREIRRPAYFDAFRETKLLPRFDIETWEDEVRGRHAGAAFTLCETHLKKVERRRNRRTTRTVFHGQLVVIEYPKPFLGVTVVRRDRGLLNRFTSPGDGFSRVGLASAEFEKAFEAWSTDQVEARVLLDPLVLERFQALERLFKGKSVRAAFTGGRLVLAIETGDRLNMGSMFRPLDRPARVENILSEFVVIFDLIDVLIRRADRRLDGPLTAAALRA